MWTGSYWLEVSDPRVREKKSEPDAKQFNIPLSLKSAAGLTFSLADCACQVLAEVLVGLPGRLTMLVGMQLLHKDPI